MLQKIETWLTDLGTGVMGNLLSAVLILVIGLVVIRLVMMLVKKTLAKSKLEKAAHTLILSLAQVAMYILLALSVASALGIDVTGVVALASVLTLALSLALQNMVSNVIGGFTILSTAPFRSGDYVEIAGQGGTVEEINMTYTRLSTPDNRHISIPNSAVVAAQIVNYSAAPNRRVDVNVAVSYETPVEQALEALRTAAKVDKVLEDPAPFAALVSYGESAINYTLRVWVKNEDYWDVYFALNENVNKVFAEKNVEMTYPHLKVHLEK